MQNFIDNYKSLCSEFYDLDKPFAPEEVLDFYIQEIKNSKQPVLEPMCGTGRFLIPLLELGIDIEGADASSEMLIRCKINSQKKNLNPVLFNQKIQDFKLPGKYGSIIIPAGSFGLITDDEEIKQSLRSLNFCLKKGGIILIEIETPEGISGDGSFQDREMICNDNSIIKLTTTSEFDLNNNSEKIKCEYVKMTGNEIVQSEIEFISIKYHHENEFKELLETEGFIDIEKLNVTFPGDSGNNIIFRGIKS